MCASVRFVLPCWYAVSSSAVCFSSVAAVTHFLNIYELQSYVRKLTVQHVTHVPGCVSALLTFMSWESSQNEVPHSFFSVSRHGNMTPCEWCIVIDQIEKQRCEHRPHWMKNDTTYIIFVLLYSWMVPEVLADLLIWPNLLLFVAAGQTSKRQWSQNLANNRLNSIWTKCLHTLDLLRQALQHIFSWI